MLLQLLKLHVFVLDEMAGLLGLLLITMLSYTLQVILLLWLLPIYHHYRIAEPLDLSTILNIMFPLFLLERRLRCGFAFLR
jgi:hypothetical protein